MYGFYIYEDEDTSLVPSEMFEVNEIENIMESLKDNLVVVVPDKPKKQLWFFSKASDVLNAYALGMSYGIVDLTPKNWKKIFYNE